MGAVLVGMLNVFIAIAKTAAKLVNDRLANEMSSIAKPCPAIPLN